ncbi:MAG: hypothetical protein ACOYIK_11250, partial [Coriobacteriales bacterium]
RDIILTEVDEWYNHSIMSVLEIEGVDAHPVKACNQIDLFQSAVANTHGVLLMNGHLPCEPGSGIAAVAIRHEPGRFKMGFYSRRANRDPCVENFLRQWR